MNDTEKIVKQFKCYSALADEELIPLAEEYISDGHRKRTVIVLTAITVLLSIFVGLFTGVIISIFEFDNSFALNGISAGVFVTLLFAAITMYQRIKIKRFLKSKGRI